MTDLKHPPISTATSSRSALLPIGIGVLAAVGLFAAQHTALGILVIVLFSTRLILKRLFAKVPDAPKPEAAGASVSDDAKAVRRQLSQAKYLEHIDTAQAERALNQFDQIVDRQKQFSKSLALRFEPTEMAYERYNSAVAQVCTSVLDQLKRMAEIFNQLSAMNLKQLEAQGLQDRLALGKKLETDLQEFLSRNESAITELDRLILAVNEVKTSKSTQGAATQGDYDALLEQLQELAERAKKYSL